MMEPGDTARKGVADRAAWGSRSRATSLTFVSRRQRLPT